MSETASDDVLAVNATFYATMREGDMRAMDRLWSEKREVSCTHPGRPSIFGRKAVMASWHAVFASGAPLEIHEVEAHVTVTGGVAVVLCIEVLGAWRLMASNVFVREGDVWRMINHQACEIVAAETP